MRKKTIKNDKTEKIQVTIDKNYTIHIREVILAKITPFHNITS